MLDDLICFVLGWPLCRLADRLPAILLRRHREAFRLFWRWKSQNRGGRPRICRELIDLIRRMSRENPLWGAPRIHGELMKLGFQLAPSTVSKYMIPRCGRPTQTWMTFLRNHCEAIAAIDLLAVQPSHSIACMPSSCWRTTGGASCTSKSQDIRPHSGWRTK